MFFKKAILFFHRGVLLVLGLGLALGVVSTCSGEPTSRVEHPVQLSGDLSEIFARAKQSGKPIILIFGAVWCPHCRKMKRDTIETSEIRALADKFHWAYVEVDKNASIARSYDIRVIPQVYLLDSAGNARSRIIGRVGPVEFRRHLEGFLEEMAKEDSEVHPGPPDVSGFNAETEVTWTPRGYRGHSICFSHVGYGPLRIKSQSPFQAFRLGLVPRTPSTLVQGEFELRANGTWVNIWARQSFDYLLDYETLDLTFSAAYGITDYLQAEIEFGNRSRFGGEMDGFIQGFHDLFGIKQNGRDDFPKNDLAVRLEPRNGEPGLLLDSGDRGTFARNLLVTLQHTVTCGTSILPAFSYAVTARADLLGSDALEGGWLDLGGSVALSRRFLEVFYAYLSLGFVWFGSKEFHGIDLRRTQLSGLAAVEWRFRPNMSLILQYLVTEGVTRKRRPFSKPSHEVTLGWRGEILERTVLEIGLIENVVTYDNSPDFGVHIGLAYRF